MAAAELGLLAAGELRPRDQARAMESSHRLAVRSFWLTIANAALAGVAAVAAVVALAAA
jgi:hypothetical protein